MAESMQEIRVFAQSPHSLLEDPELYVQPSNWRWVNCLTFPLETLIELQLSPKLYKWIRYATGVFIGMQGDLSFVRDSPTDVVDYDVELPSESADLYYHTSDIEKRRMFPIDPRMGRTHVTSGDVTSRMVNFRRDIVARDAACVLTGYEAPTCDAAHLMPHSKGDDYIRTYTQHRSRDPNGSDIVNEIDDVRNGILLNFFTHHYLGETVAFLITPNFAMSTTDIDPTASPTEKRCTAHLFDPNLPQSLGNPNLHSGSAVRMSGAVDSWPPDILFDAVYAYLVWRKFAPKTEDIAKEWESIYYSGGIKTTVQANYQGILDERGARSEEKKRQGDARSRRYEERVRHTGGTRGDTFDMLLMMPNIFMPPEELEAGLRKVREKRAEEERKQLADKVGRWTRNVEEACR